MSAQTLRLVDTLGRSIEVTATSGFTIVNRDEHGKRMHGAYLTREHAHMLYLYLADHLGYRKCTP